MESSGPVKACNGIALCNTILNSYIIEQSYGIWYLIATKRHVKKVLFQARWGLRGIPNTRTAVKVCDWGYRIRNSIITMRTNQVKMRMNQLPKRPVAYTFDVVAPNIPAMKQNNNNHISFTWRSGTTQFLWWLSHWIDKQAIVVPFPVGLRVCSLVQGLQTIYGT
jgi:hypothetical protein